MTQTVYGRVGKTYAAPVRALARRVSPMIQARYDAAQDTEQTRKHWRNADSLSAREANSLPVRKKLRNNARYEYANNSYMDGIIQTICNNLVGAGPRLQVTTPDAELNAAIEVKYAEWVKASRFVDQLRIMKAAKTVDGESFTILCANPMLANVVQLDTRPVECDQFTNGDLVGVRDRSNVDGIIFDMWGNPSTYDVLKNHPGDRLGIVREHGERNFDRLPASRVLHWFRVKRPGMVRGIPEVTPALPLFAMLRAFALSTLTAAQTASMFAAVIETEGAVDPADEIKFLDIVNGMMARLPDGTKMHQFQAAHPASTFDMFVKCILREIARCLCIPWHMASGDYSDSNYASSRLGSQDFRLAMKVERQDCECEVIDPTFAAWLHEAMLTPGYLPLAVQAFRDPHLEEVMAYQRSYRGVASIPHKWLWPGWDYLDPQTEASADSERLKNGTATLDDICSSQNKDWRQVVRQQAIEEAFRNQVKQELGLGQQPAAPDNPAPEAAPVQASADIEACGGKGGTPGPCPTGGGGKGGGSSKGPAGPRPNVDAVAGKVKTLAAGKLSGPQTKALANDMAGMTAPELKELKGKLAGSVSPEKAKAAKATATAAVAKAKAAPKPVDPAVVKPTADLYDNAGVFQKDFDSDAIQKHVDDLGKKSKREINEIAKSVNVHPASKDTKAAIQKKIYHAIVDRQGRQRRTRV